MAINRQQVEELRSNISIQPAADPVDRTIISKAPNITPDPTMNAWTEMARDFAAGFTAMKKAQVEADIPMGEKYFLESGIDGLFEAGKQELGQLSMLVEHRELAEEHSVGTRIGFERAAGRSAAYHERSAITAALDKFIQESGGLDENGLPKLPTAADVDRVIGQVRAERFGQFTSRPEYAWFNNSPYAAEEYNKLTRDFLPQVAENYKQKARERLTEQKRALVAEQAVGDLIEIFELDGVERANKLAAFGAWVDDNVRLGSIQDPKKFLAETMKTAGLTWMNNNPGANMPQAMADFNRAVVDGYNFKGATLSGLYGGKTKDDLMDEARRRTSQHLADRELRVRRAIDEDTTNADKDGSLTFLINSNMQKELSGKNLTGADRTAAELKAIRDSVNTWRERRANDKEGNPKYLEEVIKGITTPYLSAVTFQVQVENANDAAVEEAVVGMLMDPNKPNAAEEARKMIDEQVIHPTNKAKLYNAVQKAQDAKVSEKLFKDPVFKVQLGEFKELQKPIRTFSGKDADVIAIDMGIDRKQVMRAPLTVRTNIKNKAIDDELKRSYNEANFGLVAQISQIEQNPDIPVADKRRMTAEVINTAKTMQEELNKRRTKPLAQLELNIQAAEDEFRDATPVIINAFRDGLIDADSRDSLINANKRRFADMGITQSNIRLVATEVVKNKAKEMAQVEGFNLASDPFLSKRVERVEMGFTAAEGAQLQPGAERATRIVYKPTELLEAEVATMANEIANDLPKFFMNAATRQQMADKYGIKPPSSSEGYSAFAKQLIEQRINELIAARYASVPGGKELFTPKPTSRPK